MIANKEGIKTKIGASTASMVVTLTIYPTIKNYVPKLASWIGIKTTLLQIDYMLVGVEFIFGVFLYELIAVPFYYAFKWASRGVLAAIIGVFALFLMAAYGDLLDRTKQAACVKHHLTPDECSKVPNVRPSM